jgi:hypothetical protein
MTLLACTLNIVASNNPFSKKKKSYKKSEIKITNDLAMNRDFKFKNVDKRNFELSEIALKIWKF